VVTLAASEPACGSVQANAALELAAHELGHQPGTHGLGAVGGDDARRDVLLVHDQGRGQVNLGDLLDHEVGIDQPQARAAVFGIDAQARVAELAQQLFVLLGECLLAVPARCLVFEHLLRELARSIAQLDLLRVQFEMHFDGSNRALTKVQQA
jgi:hypothetical protein